MENYLKENLTFYVVPQNIEGITTFKYKECSEGEYILWNSEFDCDFKENEEIEAFANVKNGILYFKTNIISYSDGILKIKQPEDFNILQRRESERVVINEKVILYDSEKPEDKNIGKILDISVGGMKMKLSEQLIINKPYKVHFKFDNIDLIFDFVPLRISFEDEIYQISGQLNSDKANFQKATI